MRQRLRVIGRLGVEVGGVIAICGLSEEFKPIVFHKPSKDDVTRFKDALQLSNLQVGSRWHELKHCDQQLMSSMFEKIRKTYGARHHSRSEIEEIIKQIEEIDRSTSSPIDSFKNEHIGSVDVVPEFLEEYKVVQSWDRDLLNQFDLQIDDKPLAEGVALFLKEWVIKRFQLVEYFRGLHDLKQLQDKLRQEYFLECSPENSKDEMLASALRIGGVLGLLFTTRNLPSFPQRVLSGAARPFLVALVGLTFFKMLILQSMLESLSFTHFGLKMVGAEIETDDIQAFTENLTQSEREAKQAAIELTKELIALPEFRQRWLGSSQKDPYTMERKFIYDILPTVEYPLIFYFGLLRSLLGFVSPLTAHVLTAWAYAMVEEDRVTPQRVQAGLPILESIVNNASFSLGMQLLFHILTRPGTIMSPPLQYFLLFTSFSWTRSQDLFIDPFEYIQEDTPRYKKCIEDTVKNMNSFIKYFPVAWFVPSMSNEQWQRLRTAISSNIGGDTAEEKKLRAKDLFDLFCVHYSMVLKKQQQPGKVIRVPLMFAGFLSKLPELQLDDELREKVWLSFLFESFQRDLDLSKNENREVNEQQFRAFFSMVQFCFDYDRQVDFDALITAIDARDDLSEEQGLDLVNGYFQVALDADEYVLENYEPTLFEDAWRQRLAGRLPVTRFPTKQTSEEFWKTESGNMILEINRRFTVGGIRSERKFLLEQGMSPQKLKSIANQLSMKYHTIKPLEDEWVAFCQSYEQRERLFAKMTERDDEPYKQEVYERLYFKKLRPHKDMKLT